MGRSTSTRIQESDWTDLTVVLDEGGSRTLFQGNAPKAQTSGAVIGGGGGGAHGNDPTSEYFLILAIVAGTNHANRCVSPIRRGHWRYRRGGKRIGRVIEGYVSAPSWHRLC